MKLTSIVLLAALAAGPALAQSPPPGAPAPSPEMRAAREAMQKACANDEKTLCGDKQGREMFQCMRENQDKLSQPCKDAMAKMPRRPAAPPAQ